VKSIEEITPDILYLFHKAFYAPTNMTIVCGGGVNADDVIKIAEDMAVTGSEKAKKCRLHTKAVGGVKKIKMDISVPVYCLVFPARIEGGKIKNSFIYRILGEMLFGESSDAFKQIIEEGLSEDRPIVQYSSAGDVGVFAVSGTSTKCERMAEIIKKTIREFVHRGELSSSEFDACVRKVSGEIIRSLDDSEAAVNAQTEWSSENLTASEIISMVKNLSEREIFWAAKEIGKTYGLGIVSKE
jgi:predicted Zn-dependent peptidase